MSSSSSSDEEDEHLKQLKESIDTGFINDSMFNEANDQTKEPKTKEPAKNPKSERYLDLNDGNENSVFVTESMQNHFYKKLSQTIENIVDFVDNDATINKRKRKKSKNYGIKLLRGFDEYLQDSNQVDDMPIVQTRPNMKRKPPKDETVFDDKTKIQDSVVCNEELASNFETKHWKTPANREKVSHYREKNAKLYLQEPENEFSKQRKKNNWDECKISRNYNKKKSNLS